MDVFISSAQSDLEFARELAGQLSRLGISAWYDEEISPGENWARQVADALESSTSIVALVSPEWVRSPTSKRDLEYALGSPRFEGRLLGLEIRPTKQKPWILERLQLVHRADDPKAAAKDVVNFLSRKREAVRR